MNDDIQKLTPYQHLRLRTEVWLGSRALHTQEVLTYDEFTPRLTSCAWVPALFTCLREIVDNALDEMVVHGYGNRLDIHYDAATLEVTVEDNGRGIPIDWDEQHKKHKATLALSDTLAGRNFGERGATAGMNGVGASAVCNTAAWFRVEIYRDGKRFIQEFEQGNIVTGDALQIAAPRITRTKSDKTRTKSDKTGTKITYRPSHEVYPDRTLPESFVYARVAEIAACNPGLKVVYNGKLLKVKPTLDKTLFEAKKPIVIDIDEKLFASTFYLLPDFGCEGEHFHSLVNNIPVFHGGTHVETFRRYFFAGFLAALDREAKRRKLTPNRSDVGEGLLVYNVTRMVGPNFDSQTKTRLISEDAVHRVRARLDDPDLYKAIIRKNPEWIDAIFRRCADRTEKKDSVEVARLAKKMLRNKVPGLTDATGLDRRRCILLIAEGDSAIAGAASVRNPDVHGGLGLRGKVLNVNGESAKTVLDSRALADIMNAIKLVPGQRVNRHALHYGKVYICADMDPDGANVSALLINFFYTFWPELFDPTHEPFVHVMMTPFIIARKGKQVRYWYAHDAGTFEPARFKGWEITRAKGLGSLTEEDWAHSLSTPTLMRIIDDGRMAEALDLIFNKDRAAHRRDWIGL